MRDPQEDADVGVSATDPDRIELEDPGESLEAAGAEVRVSLNDDGTPRAWLVPDHAELEVVGAELSAEGAALPARGSTDRLPQGSGWATWKVDGTKGTATPAEIDEQVRRLKALGYLR